MDLKDDKRSCNNQCEWSPNMISLENIGNPEPDLLDVLKHIVDPSFDLWKRIRGSVRLVIVPHH